jgi:PAS domain S-box-containing protein
MSLGVLPGVQGLLEPAVALYGLRLNRAFGPKRVGWCLVAAFTCIALVHLIKPDYAFSGVSDVAAVLIGFLLLLALAHVELLVSGTLQFATKEEALRQRLALESAEKTKADEANLTLSRELESTRCQLNALLASERQFRALFTSSPLPMWIYQLRSYKFLAVNDAALAMLGFSREEFLERDAKEIRPADELAGFFKHSETPNPPPRSRAVWRHLTRDRQLLYCRIHCLDLTFDGAPARLVHAEDVTENHLRELENRHTDRMEAASQLACGVAHHFNNAITPIIGYTDLLAGKIQEPRIAQQLKQVSAAAMRVANLTNQLSGFGRREPPAFAVIDLNTLLGNSSAMLRRLLGRTISFAFKPAGGLPQIFGDSEQLLRALAKIVLNAHDAMPNGGGVIVSTGTTRVDIPSRGTLKPGDLVAWFSVQDTGCGITPELQPQVFDPFFTTREAEGRTGLGLATAYAIVHQHHGWIELKSEPGVGSEFKVFLPCVSTSA